MHSRKYIGQSQQKLEKGTISNHLINVISENKGPVLCLTLWNILYNHVLELQLLKEANPILFTDDLVIMVKNNLNGFDNENLRRVETWIEQNERGQDAGEGY